MRIVIQRVNSASVSVSGEVIGQISKGCVVLHGIQEGDTQEDQDYILRKLLALRIFSDSNGKMNLSIQDIEGEILIVSQFTLYADTKKGNRPSFTRAENPIRAEKIYKNFVKELSTKLIGKVSTGIFAADMQVSLQNDGPVTVIIDSREKNF